MKLDESFWRLYELDLCASVKLLYLDWALRCLQEPPEKYRHLLIWEDKETFCIIHSKYGRTFSLSPWSSGVRGIRKREIVKKCIETDQHDRNLKLRLSQGTARIRESIRTFIRKGNIEAARDTVLTWYWMKLGPHEILFDRLQYGYDQKGRFKKGRWVVEDESEGCTTLAEGGFRGRTSDYKYVSGQVCQLGYWTISLKACVFDIPNIDRQIVIFDCFNQPDPVSPIF